MIKDARFLIELDISNNRMQTAFMQRLASAISVNRQLQVVNLSLNFFTSYETNDYMTGIAELDQQDLQVDNKSQLLVTDKERLIMSDRNLRAEPALTPEEALLARQQELSGSFSRTQKSTVSVTGSMDRSDKSAMSKRSTTPKRQVKKGPVLNETPEERQRRIYSNYEFLLEKDNARSPHASQHSAIVQSICTMVKRNKALIHLDLSQTNLTEFMLWHIGKALTRARSIISLHLSGN